MKFVKPAIVALALGCTAPLALAQTTYGNGTAMDNSTTVSNADKCSGMTGAAWDRCMAKKNNKDTHAVPRPSGAAGDDFSKSGNGRSAGSTAGPEHG